MIADTVQVSKAVVIVSLLQSCFIYVHSSFLTIVAVLSQIYIGTGSCYFVPLVPSFPLEGKKKRDKLRRVLIFLLYLLWMDRLKQ